MIRKSLFILPAFLSLLGCGGAQVTTTVVNASVAVPFDLLQVDSFDVQLVLLSPAETTVLQGPLKLTFDKENSIWSAEIEKIDGQDFEAEVDIVGSFENQDVILATAARPISIPKGAPSATITFKPSDFDTDIDTDQDTLTNIEEFLNDLSPFVADTDGDGITDDIELGGSV